MHEMNGHDTVLKLKEKQHLCTNMFGTYKHSKICLVLIPKWSLYTFPLL